MEMWNFPIFLLDGAFLANVRKKESKNLDNPMMNVINDKKGE